MTIDDETRWKSDRPNLQQIPRNVREQHAMATNFDIVVSGVKHYGNQGHVGLKTLESIFGSTYESGYILDYHTFFLCTRNGDPLLLEAQLKEHFHQVLYRIGGNDHFEILYND